MNTYPTVVIRPECPPGACVCGLAELQQSGHSDLPILRLNREEEKRLLARLERIDSLRDLRHMQERMHQQLGIRLSVSTSPNEVRTLRGITILVQEQPGLCRKTRQAIPAAIRRSMEQRPDIVYDLLNEDSLFSAP